MDAPVTQLIVTIDTEEEGLWGGKYRSHGNAVENIRGIPRFQNLCDRFGIRPVYLIDAPVVEEPFAVDLLKEIHEAGKAEIGTHLHPWCNPPFDEEYSIRDGDTRFSYMCNLPEQLQREKLTWLTEQIEEKFSFHPTSFRAGRYGMNHLGIGLLRELGYKVDSSVIPFSDFEKDHGPNFDSATSRPYRVSNHSILEADDNSDILEIPVAVGFNRTDFKLAHFWQKKLSKSKLQKIRVVGILDRLNLLRRIKFSPEQSNFSRMKQLVEKYLDLRIPFLTMMFHSSSLVPGNSPYVKTENDLERFFQTLEKTFDYCLNRKGMKTTTLTAAAEFSKDLSRSLEIRNSVSSLF